MSTIKRQEYWFPRCGERERERERGGGEEERMEGGNYDMVGEGGW